jgi:hypothetical protein
MSTWQVRIHALGHQNSQTTSRVGGEEPPAVTTAKKKDRKWSAEVARTSDALDLEQGVFALRSPRQIAASLKRSAERSRRRKADPFRSAMSMLNYFINRAGRNLSPERRRILEQAKMALRKEFGRD